MAHMFMRKSILFNVFHLITLKNVQYSRCIYSNFLAMRFQTSLTVLEFKLGNIQVCNIANINLAPN
jgi:hypothetical protein